MRRFWRWVALYAAKKAGLPVEHRKVSVPTSTAVANKPIYTDTAYAPIGSPQRRSAMDRYSWSVEGEES